MCDENRFSGIEREKIAEISSIPIDTTLPVEKRLQKFVSDGGNLEWRRKGESLIKISHFGNGRSFTENFAEILRRS